MVGLAVTMSKAAAGLLMYRKSNGQLEVFLVHPGGPFWRNKDEGVWSIPKGHIKEGEDLLLAAKREFREETSFEPEGEFWPVGIVKRSDSGIVHIWAFEGDVDPKKLKSNTTFITWPPKSNRRLEIPEVDRGDFFSIDEASAKILKYQAPLLGVLVEKLKER